MFINYKMHENVQKYTKKICMAKNITQKYINEIIFLFHFFLVLNMKNFEDLKSVCILNEFNEETNLPIDPIMFSDISADSIIEIFDRCYDINTIRILIETNNKNNSPHLDPSTKKPLPKSVINYFKETTGNYVNLNISTIPLLNVNMISLDLSKNLIENISCLSHLKSILKLNVSFNKIKDISVIINLKTLKEFYANNNLIESVPELSNSIEILKLSNNKINNISKMNTMTNIVKLKLNSNNITDISSLSCMKKVEYLSLSSNKITSVKILGNLENLTELYLKNNNIIDTKYLCTLNKLNTLNIENTGIKNEDIDKLRIDLRDTNIIHTIDNSMSVWEIITFIIYAVAFFLIIYFIYLSTYIETKVLREGTIYILLIMLFFVCVFFIPYLQYWYKKYNGKKEEEK